MLTGLAVSPGPLIAVKIDNTSAGFPQFGVAKADIVYVQQVEGGLTRLVVLFRSELPTEVGPVRSVRSTDSELLPMFGKPGLAFSGGAGGPLERLAKTDVVNLSPDTATSAYWRSKYGGGTHNLHVDLAKLAADRKLDEKVRSPGFVFNETDARLAKAPKVGKIAVTMLNGRVSFVYGGGRYYPQHGTEHARYVDHDGSKVVADNVLIQYTTNEQDGTYDSVGSPSYLSHSVGRGTYVLFRDGKKITGTWSRPSIDKPTQYLAAGGKPALFKPGKTWVVLAPQSTDVVTS